MMKRFYVTLFLFVAALSFAATSHASPGVAETGEEGHHLSGVESPSEGFHHLWEEVMMDIIAIGVIFSIVTIYFLIRYRRKNSSQEGSPPKMSLAAKAGWVLIPVFIFLADDLFIASEGWTLWNKYRNVPEENYEIQVESMMWSWGFKYPEGVSTINEMRVPVGTPILLRMKSLDVVHSLFIPEFKVKEDSMPGRITYMWFLPKEEGEYVLTCAEFCGVMHSMMHGKVIVMAQDEFDKWYEAERAKVSKGGA